MFVIFVVILTTGISLLATTLLVVLLASPKAVLTIFLATAVTPNRVRRHFQSPDRSDRVVAGDDQLTTPRTFFGRLVSNHHA